MGYMWILADNRRPIKMRAELTNAHGMHLGHDANLGEGMVYEDEFKGKKIWIYKSELDDNCYDLSIQVFNPNGDLMVEYDRKKEKCCQPVEM